MSIDVWIALVACLSGVWGVIVTFWAPTTNKKKALCVVPFVILAVIGVVLVRVQSKQREAAELASADALKKTQDTAERTGSELFRVRQGMEKIQILLTTPATPEARANAAAEILRSLQSPLTMTAQRSPRPEISRQPGR